MKQFLFTVLFFIPLFTYAQTSYHLIRDGLYTDNNGNLYFKTMDRSYSGKPVNRFIDVVYSAKFDFNGVKKMEEAGIIKGSSLNLDYVKLGYSFIAYIGIFLEKTKIINDVIKSLNDIPFVTVAHITTGKFNIFCKVRAHDTKHAKEIIFMIDDIDGVSRTETMISLEESINDKKRLMHRIFNEL